MPSEVDSETCPSRCPIFRAKMHLLGSRQRVAPQGKGRYTLPLTLKKAYQWISTRETLPSATPIDLKGSPLKAMIAW